jgi:hypothetical protein
VGKQAMDRYQAMTVNARGKTCHYTHLSKGYDMERKSTSRVYSFYYNLKCCIEE